MRSYLRARGVSTIFCGDAGVGESAGKLSSIGSALDSFFDILAGLDPG